ncbi:hypothetical protein AB0H71_25470 [Nocardia sp. NPDC050697]|uniref:hypothetical protein n=1 Tax=Nocardia sp. NPDC050697 TaxID=3155158 RepID=UPI0033C727BD
MTRIANHTPHPVTLYTPDGRILARFPPHTHPARLDEIRTPAAPITHQGRNLPRTLISYRATTTNLPTPQPHTTLIVSRVLATAHPERHDLVFPLDEIRDPHGTIIGCRGLGSFHQP